jgi:hypothetical protein
MPVFTGRWSTVSSCMELTISQAMKLNLLEPGDVVVAIQGWRGGLGNSNTLRVITISTLLINRSCKSRIEMGTLISMFMEKIICLFKQLSGI